MRSSSVAQVVETTDDVRLPVGTYVTVMGGVAEYLLMKTEQCVVCPPNTPLTWNLVILMIQLKFISVTA